MGARLLIALALLPLGWLVVQIGRELLLPGSALGTDPAEALVQAFGHWALRLLLLTLTLSAVARLMHRPQWIRPRRALGLIAFTYLALHVLAYLLLLSGLQWQAVAAALWDDLLHRPYISVGAPALLILSLLAVTSTNGWQHRLGRRWKQLHLLVWPAAMLAWLHLAWQAGASHLDAWLYGGWLFILLTERLGRAVQRRWRQRAREQARISAQNSARNRASS